MTDDEADVVIVGAGLAGLVAATELARAGKRIALVDQESEANLGGQAFWSFGGLFLVDSPEQRRLGIRDSLELALTDWMGSAGFDREEDRWPRRWAEAYLGFAAGEKRSWLRSLGVRLFPVVGWAERGGYGATGHGNSVPRFHIVWGTGPALAAPFEARVRQAIGEGLVTLKARHRVTELIVRDGAVCGVRGQRLEESERPRGAPSSRAAVGDFAVRSQAVIVASGGIGGNQELVRSCWPERLGKPPRHLICGVPDYVDGSMLAVAEAAGASVINRDRMWHYAEGIVNWNPIWTNHGIRILPGPSSLWFDALGGRLPAPLFPGFDTLGTLRQIAQSGHDHSWFILDQRIIEREFALSGSEQNPDLTGKSLRLLLRRLGRGAPPPVEAFALRGEDFIVERSLSELVRRMNLLSGEELLDPTLISREIRARDAQLDNRYCKDAQLIAAQNARRYLGDRLIRVAKPHRLLERGAGPLIAVRLHLLTRKTLGGIETDLDGQVLARSEGGRGSSSAHSAAGEPRSAASSGPATRGNQPIPGLYAAGELRRRRHARLSLAGGLVPRRLPLLRPRRRAERGGGGRVASPAALRAFAGRSCTRTPAPWSKRGIPPAAALGLRSARI